MSAQSCDDWVEPDPNVWMLPAEIVKAIGSFANIPTADERDERDRNRIEYVDTYSKIWRYCFGGWPTEPERKRVKQAVFAGRASGNVLLTRRAEA